ncbi:glycosyltransferase, partial [Nostoc sp. NIES-2111]
QYSDQILAQARELGIEASVHFVGHRPDVFRWMKAMDVVVSSSIRHESLSMVALEAMALGKLVVATQVGGIGEAIQDGVCGFLAPPDDPEALAEAVERALASPDRRLIEAEAARVIRERFRSVLQCSEVISVYREIAPANGQAAR